MHWIGIVAHVGTGVAHALDCMSFRVLLDETLEVIEVDNGVAQLDLA